jgi:hypothetical protein
MYRYLVITIRTPQFLPSVIDEHYAFLDRLRRQGILELAGPFTDKSGGAYVIRAANLEEARAGVWRSGTQLILRWSQFTNGMQNDWMAGPDSDGTTCNIICVASSTGPGSWGWLIDGTRSSAVRRRRGLIFIAARSKPQRHWIDVLIPVLEFSSVNFQTFGDKANGLVEP